MYSSDNTIIILADKKEIIYPAIENLPGRSKIIIINLKWRSNIINKIIENERISIVDVENVNDLPSTLNFIMWNEIKTSKVLLIPLNKIPVLIKIQNIIQNISQRNIYIEDNIIGFWMDLNLIKSVWFHKNDDLEMLFPFFINDLIFKLGYDKIGNINLNPVQHESLRTYKISQTRSLFENEEIKENITYLVLSTRNIKIINELQENKNINDDLIILNVGKDSLYKKIMASLENVNNFIVLVDHSSESLNDCLKEFNIIKKLDRAKFPATVVSKNGRFFIFEKNNINKFLLKSQLSSIDFFNSIQANCKTIIKLKEKYKTISSNLEIGLAENKENFYLFILTFMNKGDRLTRLKYVLKNLKNKIKNTKIRAEILVHEIGETQSLKSDFIEEFTDQYVYSEWNDTFHLAWAYNVAARYCNLPTDLNSIFIFMDGDILLSDEWLLNLKSVNQPKIGWNKLYDITEEDTKKIIENKITDFRNSRCEKIRFPSPEGACGGISIIPEEVFFEVKGYPEDFKGSWGGEDNAFIRKLQAFNYDLSIPYEFEIWHLNHIQTTKRDEKIRSKWKEMKEWSNTEWQIKTSEIGHNWGIGKKIRLAMINYLREEKLIESLDIISKNTRMPIEITIQLQGEEKISKETKEKIIYQLNKFKDYNIIWSKDNVGTGIPRDNTTQDTLIKNADYTIIIDSDMQIYKRTFELLFNKIEKEPEFGAVACWCKPNYTRWKIVNNKLKSEQLKAGFIDTDVLGTGCVIVKTEVFKKAKFNRDLFIGWIDFLWCMEVTSNKWKLGILSDPNHKIFNNARNNSEEYKKARNNKEEIQKSKEYFFSKWGISV